MTSSEDELASQPDADEESDDDGEADVEEFEFEGTTYLKDDDGNIYKNDLTNVEQVGKWDKEKKCIVFNKEE